MKKKKKTTTNCCCAGLYSPEPAGLELSGLTSTHLRHAIPRLLFGGLWLGWAAVVV